MKAFRFQPLLLIILVSCIGTDFTDELIGEDLSEAIIEESEVSLIKGESYQLEFRFVDVKSQEVQKDWNFISKDVSIAEVNNSGQITGIGTGQTWISGVVDATFTDSVLVTVVRDSNAIAKVTINSPQNSLMIDSTLQFSAIVENLKGEVITNTKVVWNSSNPQFATIDSTGLLRGISTGSSQVTASSGGISSASIKVDVGTIAGRSGMFSGRNGYSVSGTATLIGMTGNASLELESDFSSQSGPGLHIYLSNNGNNVNGGLDLGDLISNSGAQSYSLPTGTNPADFSHVFIYCQPFSVPFGVAELN